MALQITALGGLRVGRNGEEIALPAQRRVRIALAVYVATERDVSRERLLSVFWPESDEDKSRHALSQALYDLRQQFGEWVIVNNDRLMPSPEVRLDASEFAEAVASRRYDVALQLYSGSFLAGVDKLPSTKAFETWLDGQRAQLERLHRTARRNFINARVAEGDVATALDAARTWVRLTPSEDEAQHRLIELLAASGQPLEAVRQYEAYERLLAADELTPLEDTRTLVERVRKAGLGVSPRAQPLGVVPAEGAFPPDLEVVRPLGAGSVASVLLAREPNLKRLVAVKVLRPDLASDEIARQRFEREAQAAATISHPNVPAVYRIGRLTNGVPFIVMEYIDGRTMEERLASDGRFSVPQTRRILTSVALALAAAHRKGVVHRHVAASNVLQENGTDRVVLMDFGLAALLESASERVMRLTRAGERIGDPRRMSPEQRAGEAVSPSSDVYALGLLGFELVLGRLPADPDVPLRSIRPDVDTELSELIGRCMATNPRRRPDAESIARILTSNDQNTSDVSTPPDPWRGFLRELKHRHVVRAFVGYVAAAFFVLQGAQLILPGLPLNDLEAWYRVIVALTLAGFPLALVLSWLFEWTTNGIQRTRGSGLRGLGVVLALAGLLISVAAALSVWFLLMGSR